MNTTKEFRSRMLDLATSKLLSKPLYVATLLGLPDRLVDHPMTAADLAVATKTQPQALYRLLRALASIGIFHEDEAGRFTTAPLGELVCDRPHSLRALVLWMNDPRHDRIWEELLHCVQTGETGAPKAVGASFWSYLDQEPSLREAFDACMSSNAAAMHAAAVASYDFGDEGVIVDVGGGQGALLRGILRARPKMRGILFDRPQVVDVAQAGLKADGLAERCEVIAGDFFAGVPAGDIHVMSHIIHDWNDKDALRLLERCHQACRPGGRIALIEMIVPPGNAPSFAKLLDLEMLVLAGGKERTEAEYRGLLAAAGYTAIQVVQSRGPAAVIEGRKA